MSDARDRTIGTMLQAQHRQEGRLVRLEAAARAMLAVLKRAEKHFPDNYHDHRGDAAAVRAAIAQAEAAGIEEET
jgi:hypothetical protein